MGPEREWRRFVVQQIAALLTGVTDAAAAFATTIPGAAQRPIAPMITLGVWLLAVGQGCIHDLATNVL